MGHRAAGHQDVDNFVGVPVAKPFAGRAVAALIDLMPMDVEEVTGSLVGMPPEKATAEVCRRMVKGIASGAVKYEAYRAWADAPDDKRVVFPDYK